MIARKEKKKKKKTLVSVSAMLDDHNIIHTLLNPFQKTNIRLLQTERDCMRHFKFDKNGGKFFKRIESTVGKGEIARYEQFLLFPQCFQKDCTAER